MIEFGKDHAVYDSRGKRIATLLRSWYPDELSLERKLRLYERGVGEELSIRPSPDRNSDGEWWKVLEEE